MKSTPLHPALQALDELELRLNCGEAVEAGEVAIRALAAIKAQAPADAASRDALQTRLSRLVRRATRYREELQEELQHSNKASVAVRAYATAEVSGWRNGG